MKRGLTALAFLSLAACDECKESMHEKAVVRENFLDVKRLNSDIEKWMSDGVINKGEKVEILRACGYDIQSSSWCWGIIRNKIWNGTEWQYLDDNLYNLALDNLNASRFLASYQK